MKITVVGPGLISIPPKGWGAIETLISDCSSALERLGVNMAIVNQKDKLIAIAEINNSTPDLVHIHYDEYIAWSAQINCAAIVATSHFGYLSAYSKYLKIFRIRSVGYALSIFVKIVPSRLLQRIGIPEDLIALSRYCPIFFSFLDSKCYISALSPQIAQTYSNYGRQRGVFVIPNGARDDLIRYTESPSNSGKSICLGKIESRKRQYLLQQLLNLDFVGPLIDKRFDSSSAQYLGEWSRDQVYNNLTDYSALVLLSAGEAHPLVCCEALIAGLGLVVSPSAAANLDISLPFVAIVPETKLDDLAFVDAAINRVISYSRLHRKEIRDYGLENFSISAASRAYEDLYRSILTGSFSLSKS